MIPPGPRLFTSGIHLQLLNHICACLWFKPLNVLHQLLITGWEFRELLSIEGAHPLPGGVGRIGICFRIFLDLLFSLLQNWAQHGWPSAPSQGMGAWSRRV